MTTASFILAHHHQESFGLGSPGTLQNAAGASALLMIALIALLCTAILIFALNLRRRSLHPSPESLLLAEVSSDAEYQDAHSNRDSARRDSANRQPWEKSDDWWKSPPSNS